MVKVKFYRNKDDIIYGFEAHNHTKNIVCSAVSVLTLNTINSIEKFTDEEFTCDFKEQGGFLKIILPEVKRGKFNKDVDLLSNSCLLGVMGIKADYAEYIEVTDGRCCSC